MRLINIGLKYIKQFKQIGLREISTLYVPGHKASEHCIILKPFINFNFESTKNSVEARQLNINLSQLNEQWQIYKDIENNLDRLEHQKNDIVCKITSLQPTKEKHKTEIEALIQNGKFIRNDMKFLKSNLWKVEEKIIPEVLKLPNSVHTLTPWEKPVLVMNFKTKSEEKTCSHLETGKKFDLIEFINPQMYFLKGKAALLELKIIEFITKELSEFTLFSNSDFVRTVVVEGCNLDPSDKNSTFVISQLDNEINRLHLTGGASLTSFMAFLSKNIIFKSLLPLKFLSTGRKYHPTNTSSKQDLYNVGQSVNAEILVVTKNSENHEKTETEFRNVLNTIISLYKKFDCHFRVIYVKASDLQSYESLRAEIQMFSPYLNDYVTTGSVSFCNTYLSERLLFQYMDGQNRVFPNIISGTVLNFPVFLACLLEQKKWETDDIFPKCLQI